MRIMATGRYNPVGYKFLIFLCLFLSSNLLVNSYSLSGRFYSSQTLLRRNQHALSKNIPSIVPLHVKNEKISEPILLSTGTNDDDSSLWSARATLLFVSALYGTNFGCVKILGEALDPSFAAVLRFTVAASIFAPYILLFGRKKPNLVRGGLEVGLYAGVGYWAQAVSLQTTHASTAAFICSLAVIVVPILDMMFRKVDSSNGNSSLNKILPALLAAAGVGCLELGGSELPGIGDLYAFLQPIFFGLSFWRVENFMKLSKASDPEDPKIFTGAMMLGVASFAAIWSANDFIFPLLSQGKSVAEIVNLQMSAFSDWHVLAAVLWTGIFTTALTSFGENVAMKKLSAAESTVIYSTEPLWGAAFAAVVLGEQLGWNTALGAILILGACLWSSLGPEVIAASIAGAGSFSQSILGEEMAEVAENFVSNFLELFKIADNQ